MKIRKEAENKPTAQTIFWFVILVIISLFLGSLPAISLGQALTGFEPLSPTPGTVDSPPSPSLSAPAPLIGDSAVSLSPPAEFSTPPPILGSFSPSETTVPTSPSPAAMAASQTPTLPFTPLAAKSNTITNQEPTAKLLQERPELLRSVASADHPFYDYFKSPNDPNSPVQGKPYTVAQLLDGVRAPSARRQLLAAYWELAGLLAEWNMRFDSERRAELWYTEANNARNTPRAEGFAAAVLLTRQQRKTTEIAFARKQYQLVEQLRSLRGVTLAAKDYPIPSDYPIAKNYVTYADKIARSERARYIGRMISYQSELVDARKKFRQAADGVFLTTTQNPQASPQDYIAVLNQRTDAFVALVTSVVDYNKTIAEYTAETVGSNVSHYRLLGAVLELPKTEMGQQTPQLASPPPNPISRLDEPPLTLASGESAYSRPLTPETEVDTPPLNPFTGMRTQPTPVVAGIPSTSPPEPLPMVAPAVLTTESVSSADTSNPVQPTSYIEEN